ncbi:MAG: hypothetical protein Q8M16_10250 [Pirellulaceae bacterium]|nr:hypothetical protein [Pirellulaceae bacterium]
MSDDRTNNDSRSWLWLWPVVGTFWCGLIIETWLATPNWVEANAASETMRLSLELALVVWIPLSLIWLVCSTETVRRRCLFTAMTILGGFSLVVLAGGRPGGGIIVSSVPFQTLGSRRYFPETLNLSTVELILLVVSAGIALGLINRFTGNIRFHRCPLPKRSNSMTLKQRRLIAYRSENQTSPVMMRSESRALVVGLVVWMLLFAWACYDSNLVSAGQIATHGLAAALYLFLVVWCAGHCLSSWLAGFVLAVGMFPFLTLPGFGKIGRLLLYSTTNAEVTIALIVSATVAVATVLSVILLVLTHQAPRRFAFAKVDNPDVTSADTDDSNKRAIRTKSEAGLSVVISRSAVLGSLLWIACGGFAYWLPRSIDPVVLAQSDPLSIPLASFSAQVMACHDGQRTFRYRPSEHEQAKGRHYYGNASNLESEYNLFNYNSWSPTAERQLTLPELNQNTDALVQPLTDLINQSIIVNVQIMEPVEDMDRLAALLDTGAMIHCNVNAKHQPLPVDRLSKPNLIIQDVYSVSDDLATWAFLSQMRTFRGREPMFVDCQFPVEPSFLPSERILIYNCRFPVGFLMHQPTLRAAGNHIQILKLSPGQKFTGPELATFLQNGGVIVAAPPFDSIVAEDFPPIFVPDRISTHESVWQPSARPLLLDSNVAQAAISQRLLLPKLIEVDTDGRLTALGLTASRDCPTVPAWTTFPDVKRLYITLGSLRNYDNRRAKDEEFAEESIGFQSKAFPALESVVFESTHTKWIEVEDSFVRDVLSTSQLKQVIVSVPFDQFLAAADVCNAEQLVVDATRHWGFARANPDEFLKWVSELHRMKNLKEVVIIDPNEVTMAGAANPIGTDFVDFTAAAQQKTRQVLTDQWTERIHAVAPHLKVRVVDQIPDPGKENDELDD